MARVAQMAALGAVPAQGKAGGVEEEKVSKFKRESNVDVAFLRQVIVVESVIGEGTMDDPIHVIRDYYATDGTFLARSDLIGEIPSDD